MTLVNTTRIMNGQYAMANSEVPREMRESYAIPDPNFNAFKERIERLAKRATRLGFPIVGFEETGTSFKKFKKESGAESPSILIHHVEVYGERPFIKGWRFCGKLEHIPGTNDVVVKELNDGDVPAQYLACDPNCDHCKTNRNRRDTFVIRNNESGEYKQIGRSCLSDFFGGKDPEAVAALFEFMQEGREILHDLEDWEREGSISLQSLYYDPERILGYASSAVRVDGSYISARDAEERGMIPTGHLVRSNLTVPTARLPKSERLDVQAVDQAQAEAILAWLRSDAVATKDETYFHNLRVMTEAQAVSYRNIGLYASAVAAFERDKAQRLAMEAADTSCHVGTEGEKITLKVNLVGLKTIPGHQFGDKLLHRFVDEEGNLFVWFCSGQGCDMAPGNSYHVRATVKKHEEYRGAKQTTLERVSCPDMKIFDLIDNYDGDLKGFVKKLKAVEDVDVKESRWGRTPLLKAIIWEHEDIARELLKAGASLDARDNHGTTAEIARPEIYERLRSEGLASGWIKPAPGTSYGFIQCEESAVEMLRSFGVRAGAFDIVKQGVLAEVPPVAQVQIAKFPADFKTNLQAYDPHDEDAVRAFEVCQASISPTDSLKVIWTEKMQESSQLEPSKPRRQKRVNAEAEAARQESGAPDVTP